MWSRFLRIVSECDRFVEILHHQRWRPNLRFHFRQKLLVILHYSKSFKWMRSNQNTWKMYKIIQEFLKRFCGWVKPHSSESSVRNCSRLGRLGDWEYVSLVLNTLHNTSILDGACQHSWRGRCGYKVILCCESSVTVQRSGGGHTSEGIILTFLKVYKPSLKLSKHKQRKRVLTTVEITSHVEVVMWETLISTRSLHEAIFKYQKNYPKFRVFFT